MNLIGVEDLSLKILVIRKAGGLGDVVCCEPVVRGLRKQHPHAEITFICPTEYQDLFKDRKDATFKTLHYVRMSGRWLKKYRVDNDIFVDLCGPESDDESQGSPECSRIESFCNYARVEATAPRIDLTREEQKKAKEELNIYPKPWIGLGENGRQWAKNWPTEHWGELAKKLPGTVFYFDQDRPCEHEGVVSIVGKSLREAMGLISILDLMITVDTGLLHLSAALGTKTLSVWGPTDAHRTLKHYKDAYFIEPAPYREAAGCPKPCLHDPWNCAEGGEKFSKCMRLLKADTVAEHAVEILRDKVIPDKIKKAKKAKYYKTNDGIPPTPDGKQRIVFAAKHLLPPIGGAERYAMEMLKQLRDDGHDVVAIWSHPEGSPFRHLKIEHTDGITWVQSPEGVILNNILSAEPDIVITQLTLAPKVARIIPKTTKLLLFLHSVGEHFCERIGSGKCVDGGSVDLLTCNGCEGKSFRNMKLAYQCADEVFAVSQSMADIFKKFTGRTALVQYPVVDPVRCETEKPPTKQYCVSIKVNENRGQAFLTELASSMPDERFLWVDSPSCNLPNVTVMNRREDLRSVLDKAFLLLAPHKHYEAFGRCTAEAGWASVTSLVSDSGGLPESAGDGGVALPLDITRWKDEIIRLRKDGREWSMLSHKALEHSRGFNWDTLQSVVGVPDIILPISPHPITDKPLNKVDKPEPVENVERKLSPYVSCEPTKGDMVSVVIPTYNRAELLQTAVDSALAKKHDKLEVIIVDDGSTDDTKAMVKKKYGRNKKVRYIYKENGNTATALNRGIKESNGDYVCWLSDDDYFENTKKTQMQLKMFNDDPLLRLVHSDFYIDNGGGSRSMKVVPDYDTQDDALKSHLDGECLINGSTVMFDKRIFKEVGLFNHGYRYCQDTDMWARVLAHTKVGCIHEPLSGNLQHPGNLGYEYMQAQTKEQQHNWDIFEKEKEMVAKHGRMFGPRPTICAMICMKNEEKNIDRCLNDLIQWVDSIVVFNDGSTDSSPNIVRGFPKVSDIHDSPPKGELRTEGDDRRKLLDMAVSQGTDWILFIDADEVFDNMMKWIVYDLITDNKYNLYYAQEVNCWRSNAKFRSDGLWCGWFPRLFRNTQGLSMGEEDEHCGGVPYNIPGADMFPSGNSPKGLKIPSQVLHYSFAEWEDTVSKYMRLMERDPEHIGKRKDLRGGAKYYDRVIDEHGLELTEYLGNSVADHMERGNI